MALLHYPKWHKWLPLLDVTLSLPRTNIRAAVMSNRDSYQSDLIEISFVALNLELYKWHGHIKLYKIGERFLPSQADRLIKQDMVEPLTCGCKLIRKYKLRIYCNNHFEQLF